LKLLVYAKGSDALAQLAQKICEGITKTGNSFCTQLPCDAAFLGTEFDKKQETELLDLAGALAGKRIAVFCIRSDGKEKLETLLDELNKKGACTSDSLSIKLAKKIFGGTENPSEEDFARAAAFAEKTVNRWQGRRVAPPSEKTRIQGYAKPHHKTI